MTSVVGKSRMRRIAMNPSNTAGNEVEGTATGGVEKIIAADGKKVKITVIMCTAQVRGIVVGIVWLTVKPVTPFGSPRSEHYFVT